MFNRKFAVLALVALSAVSAFGSNFRGADQIYVPVAAKVTGGGGVTFITDAYLANLSADEIDVTVIFQPSGAGGGTGIEFKNMITLKGCTGLNCQGERKQFLDIVETLKARPEWAAAGNPLAFGLLMFNACKKSADCGPATQDADGISPNFRDMSVESRIYSIPSVGSTKTTGQLFSGIPWYNYASSLSAPEKLDKVFITGIRDDGAAGTVGTFRSNLGVVNASQYSSTTIVLKLYQGSMQDADLKGTATVSLGPLGHVQNGLRSATFFPNAAAGTNYFVTVEQTNNIATGDAPAGCTQGCPGFLAYGSVLDNETGDATTLESQYLVSMDPDALLILYPGAGKGHLRRSVRH